MLPIRKLQHGFTLIEMLVVIAIISILIGIGINTFTIAQKKARDTKRKADIRTIQTAMEAYKLDRGFYPKFNSDGTANNANGFGPGGYACFTASNLQISGIESYLPTIPVEQPPVTSCHCYMYYLLDNSGAFDKYSLFAVLENASDSDATKVKDAPVRETPGTAGSATYTLGTCPAYNYWVNGQ